MYELFFRAGGFHLFPERFGEHEQVVEFAGALQPLAAVNHYTFAVDVLRHVANEERGEISQLVVFAEALHGIRIAGVIFEFF